MITMDKIKAIIHKYRLNIIALIIPVVLLIIIIVTILIIEIYFPDFIGKCGFNEPACLP